jgi:hypothetical protein
MGSGDNLATDISERLQLTNVKEANRSSNKVNDIAQVLMQNHRCTGVDYMKKKLSYLPLEGWYEIDSGKLFNRLSATNKWRGTRRAHLL